MIHTGKGVISMALLKDISEICGVSISTASKALRDGYSDISPQTRERIKQTARELDYHAKGGNKKTIRKKSGMFSVLMVYPDEMFRREYYRQIMLGMILEAEETGYDLLLMPGKNSVSRMSCLGRVVRRSPDGICLLCDEDYLLSGELMKLLSSDYPVMAVESDLHVCSTVRSDEKKNARILMEYLTWSGHTSAAYYGDSSLFSRRAAHYLMEAAIEQNMGEFRVLSGSEKIAESCVIFDTVSHAEQWIESEGSKYRIPEDLSVAAFKGEKERPKGLEIAHVTNSPLRLGREALRELIRIASGPAGDLKETVYLAGTLVEGSSVRFIPATG